MQTGGSKCLSIVLAAGEGTRMRSSLPKVLHEVAGLPMVGHVLKTVADAGGDHSVVIVGREAPRVQAAAERVAEGTEIFEQAERLGTAHAVLSARDALARGFDQVLVLFGDTPLTTTETLKRMRAALSDGADVVVLGFRTDEPTGYGRLLMEGDRLLAIREEKEATDAEKAVTFCNGGIMGFAGADALSMLEAITNDNNKGEYYLTDLPEVANARGKKVVALEADFEEVLGVNNRAELSDVEAIWQRRARREFMLAGVTMRDPATVHLNYDTQIGADAVLGQNIVFGPGAVVEEGAVIHPFCHIEGARISKGATIGPFARLRPGADIAEDARVGNFCEVKKATIAKGAKVNHLTYIGDAQIGAGANIGAGTITCNYDGANKHLTQIGAGAFIGSNSALVAPVSIGDGAYVGSGSVITDDVPADALAIARGRQANLDGYGAKIRERNAAEKAKRAKS
ncbi:MAG: bifunctional UDP-N-acetylglucosamine diphosphorylase/glucosamine-1-phosphate N-acetyltransferase GlmU [Pseudomonadota bacterium]